MNRIYKVIWSKVKNQYVVVSELAHSNTKSSGKRITRIVGRTAAAVLASLMITAGGIFPAQAKEVNVPVYGLADLAHNANAHLDSEDVKEVLEDEHLDLDDGKISAAKGDIGDVWIKDRNVDNVDTITAEDGKFEHGLQVGEKDSNGNTPFDVDEEGDVTMHDATVTGKLTAENVEFKGNQSVDGDFDVTGDQTVNGSQTVGDGQTVNGGQTVTGGQTVYGDSINYGNETTYGDSVVAGSQTVTEGQNVSGGQTVTGGQTVHGDSINYGDETTYGDSVVAGSQTVTEGQNVSGGQTVTGGQTVHGDSINYGDEKTYGDSVVAGSQTVTEGQNVSGGQTVTGGQTVHGDSVNYGNETTYGNSTIKGSQTVQENQTVGGDSTIKGSQTVQENQTVGGDSHINGNQVVDKDQTVGGDSHINGNQIVDGHATFNDSISVKGQINVNGETYISKDGFNANNHKITNVADGLIAAGSKDAVNGSQLNDAWMQINENKAGISDLNNRVNGLGTRIDKVGANAAALAALHPLDFDPDDKLSFAAGYGNYAGENAVAVGAFYQPNEDTMFSVGGTFGNDENMVNAGVSFKLGQKSNVSRSRVSMAKELVALRDEVAQLKALMAHAGVLPADAQVDTSALFPDVPQNHWAYEYVHELGRLGILEGYADGNFEGDRMMTRYEMAAIVYRAMQKGVNIDSRMLKEFEPELKLIRVDVVARDDDGNPTIERVRVNEDVQQA